MNFLLDEHCLSIRKACSSIGLSRSAWYRPLVDWIERDDAVAEALSALADSKPGLGFWKLFARLRRMGHLWNHKRVYRVYCRLKLNLRRRTRKRVPVRNPLPLFVPEAPNRVWSADFMSDALYNGVRFRTFNWMTSIAKRLPSRSIRRFRANVWSGCSSNSERSVCRMS